MIITSKKDFIKELEKNNIEFWEFRENALCVFSYSYCFYFEKDQILLSSCTDLTSIRVRFTSLLIKTLNLRGLEKMYIQCFDGRKDMGSNCITLRLSKKWINKNKEGKKND